jgi:hypothetical protein
LKADRDRASVIADPDRVRAGGACHGARPAMP